MLVNGAPMMIDEETIDFDEEVTILEGETPLSDEETTSSDEEPTFFAIEDAVKEEWAQFAMGVQAWAYSQLPKKYKEAIDFRSGTITPEAVFRLAARRFEDVDDERDLRNCINALPRDFRDTLVTRCLESTSEYRTRYESLQAIMDTAQSGDETEALRHLEALQWTWRLQHLEILGRLDYWRSEMHLQRPTMDDVQQLARDAEHCDEMGWWQQSVAALTCRARMLLFLCQDGEISKFRLLRAAITDLSAAARLLSAIQGNQHPRFSLGHNDLLRKLDIYKLLGTAYGYAPEEVSAATRDRLCIVFAAQSIQVIMSLPPTESLDDLLDHLETLFANTAPFLLLLTQTKSLTLSPTLSVVRSYFFQALQLISAPLLDSVLDREKVEWLVCALRGVLFLWRSRKDEQAIADRDVLLDWVDRFQQKAFGGEFPLDPFFYFLLGAQCWGDALRGLDAGAPRDDLWFFSQRATELRLSDTARWLRWMMDSERALYFYQRAEAAAVSVHGELLGFLKVDMALICHLRFQASPLLRVTERPAEDLRLWASKHGSRSDLMTMAWMEIQRHRWHDALEYYQMLVTQADKSYWGARVTDTIDNHRQAYEPVYRWASATAIESNQWEAALILLEQGRARDIREPTLVTPSSPRSPNLSVVPQDLEKGILYDCALAPTVAIEGILEAVEDSWPLVYLNLTPWGLYCVGIDHDRHIVAAKQFVVEKTSAKPVTEADVECLLQIIAHPSTNPGDQSQALRDLRRCISPSLTVALRRIVRTFVAKGGAQPKGLTLVGTGIMGAFPFNKWNLGISESEFCSTRVATSAFLMGQQIRRARTMNSSHALDKPSLLTMANSAPLNTRDARIPEVVTEADLIAAAPNIERRYRCDEENATLENLCDLYSKATYILLACHFGYDINVRKKGFVSFRPLPQSISKLEQLLKRVGDSANRPRVVMGSLCGGDCPDFFLPDDTFNFTMPFVTTGAVAVIASLWTQHSIASALISVRIFSYILEDKLEPPIALEKAQRWLSELRSESTDMWLGQPRFERLRRAFEEMPVEEPMMNGDTLKVHPFEDPIYTDGWRCHGP